MTPLVFTWDGDAMVPLARFHNAANAQFTVGEAYRMDAIEERSAASHNHYFAALHDRWMSLPEHYGDRFPSVDHLRKYALIKAGYRDERSIVAGSKAEAQRLAAFLKPMDDFAIVAVSEAVVTVYTAKSQSMRAMGKKVFQESKQAVLDTVDEMIGLKEAA